MLHTNIVRKLISVIFWPLLGEWMQVRGKREEQGFSSSLRA